LAVTGGNLERTLARCKVGETVVAHAFRRDELICKSLTLQAPPEDTCVLRINTENNLIDGWLPADNKA